MAQLNDGTFDTSPFFVGGAGFFIEYYDIIKPVWLYAVIKMIISDESYGLPIEIIQSMSVLSTIEWYKNRRYKNPLKQLDWAHEIPDTELDTLLSNILHSDPSIYKLTPMLNMDRMFDVYKQQHMNFPVVIYTPSFEPAVKEDIKTSLSGINTLYVHGDLRTAISKCDQNYTFIFSSIDTMQEACDILMGTYSYVLLATDYRYNYTDNRKTMKYDLNHMMSSHPFLRIATTSVWDQVSLESFSNVMG